MRTQCHALPILVGERLEAKRKSGREQEAALPVTSLNAETQRGKAATGTAEYTKYAEVGT